MNLDKTEAAERLNWAAPAILVAAILGAGLVYHERQPEPKAWLIETSTDPITDEVKIEATLGSDDGFDEGAMWINCSTSKPAINGYVAASRFTGADVRAGPEPIEKINYAVRFDGDKPIVGSIMGPEGQQIIDMDRPFVKRLARSEKLAYRVQDTTVVFDTTGAADAIDRLAATCNRSSK